MQDLINELRELTDEMEMPGFVDVRKRLLKMIEKHELVQSQIVATERYNNLLDDQITLTTWTRP